jgi:manganese-dependent inorganic pyrophosphatase
MTSKQTIVIGHKNPDMDAIVSAIGYAAYKKALGWQEVVAGRAGSINERVAFALGKFGVEEPQFFSDLSPRVEDVMEREVIVTRNDDPIERALSRLGERKFRGLPVVDEEMMCLGMLSSFRVTQYLFPPKEGRSKAREVAASIADIAETFGGSSLTGPLCGEVRNYSLMVAAMDTETFASRISQMDEPERTVLFVGDRSDVIALAIGLGVRAIVLTSGLKMPEDLLESGRTANVQLIESPHDTATSVLLSRSAMQARLLMDEKYRFFGPDTLLEEARNEVAMTNDFAFPVLSSAKKLIGIISKSDFLRPVPRQLILVDHNEISQAVHGADDVPIVEIIDHHRISTIITESPILFMNRPVGSTSTIVANCFEQSGIPIPQPIAGLLMCGLISDTLNLTSPTTTDVDRYVMKQLETITGQNPGDLANEVFSVGSPLLTMAAEDAINADSKPYEERGKKFIVAQIEELTFSHFWEKSAELLEALEERRKAQDLYFCALLVTDVNTQDSILLVRGSRTFRKLIDYPEIGDCMWKLEGVVSRKKQLLPYLSSLVARSAG